MGRKQRVALDGGWHHVMNRGSAHQAIFLTAGDANRFEGLLRDGCACTDVEVHAYALMSNHYHLLLRSPDNQVARFMQRLSSMYTRTFNQRLHRDGPVFRSRYHSKPIDSWEYVQQVATYIHRNPIDLPGVERLDAYRWSSYRYYVSQIQAPPWLTVGLVRGGDPGCYREFVESGKREEPPELLLWLIDERLDDFPDLDISHRPALVRAIVVLAVETATGTTRSRLERVLEDLSPSTRRVALHRARQRASAMPALRQIAQEVAQRAA